MGKAVQVTSTDPFQPNDLSLYALLSDLPGVNIQDAPYNAKCDGVSDDTAAVQAAATAMNAKGGGWVNFPVATTVCAGNLNLTNFANVRFYGQGATTAGGTKGSIIKFTGTGAGDFITGAGSARILIGNLYIYSSNNTYSGALINMNQAAQPSNTSFFTIEQCEVGTTTDTSSILLSIEGNINVTVRNVNFTGGAVQISGARTGAFPNSDSVLITDECQFTFYSVAAIRNPGGNGWVIEKSRFEPGQGSPRIQKAIQITNLTQDSLTFGPGNYLADSTSSNQVMIELAGANVLVFGNNVGAVSGTGNTMFKFVGNVIGSRFFCNFINGGIDTAFDLNGAVAALSNGVEIAYNMISSPTLFANLPATLALGSSFTLGPNFDINGHILNSANSKSLTALIHTNTAQPSCKAFNSANQSINNNVATALTFDSNPTTVGVWDQSPQISISSTQTSGGLIQVNAPYVHGFSTGDVVIIYNHNASTNGTWTITVVSTTAFTLNGSAFVANAGAAGTMQKPVHNGTINPTRFVIPKNGAGIWTVSASVTFAFNITGSRWLQVNVNGARRALLKVEAPAPNDAAVTNPATCISGSTDVQVADGDYLEFVVMQESGGALNVLTGADLTFATVRKSL